MPSALLQDITWDPGVPTTGRLSVTLDPRADMWLFRELSDAVEPAPWFVDIRSAYLDMKLHVQSRLRDPNGVVEVLFEVQFNQKTPILRISQMVPSKFITGLTPFDVRQA